MNTQSLADANKGRSNNIGFLRFLFACLVIFSHSFLLVGSHSEPLERLSHGHTFTAEIAVNFFFVISGFLITQSRLRSLGTWDYLKKRILRIYPGYCVAVIATFFVLGLLGSPDKSVYLHSLHIPTFLIGLIRLQTLPDLPAFIHNPVPHQLNGSLWTIAIEFECYLLILVLSWMRLLTRPIFIGCIFAFFLALQIGLDYHVPLLSSISNHLPIGLQLKVQFVLYFLSGTLFYLCRDRVTYSRTLFLISLPILLLCVVTKGLTLTLPILGSYALFYIAFYPGLKVQNWGRGVDISYGIYLYAWPVQQLIVMQSGGSLNPYLLTLLALPPTCLLAALSWFLVEKPCLKLKRFVKE